MLDPFLGFSIFKNENIEDAKKNIEQIVLLALTKEDGANTEIATQCLSTKNSEFNNFVSKNEFFIHTVSSMINSINAQPEILITNMESILICLIKNTNGEILTNNELKESISKNLFKAFAIIHSHPIKQHSHIYFHKETI